MFSFRNIILKDLSLGYRSISQDGNKTKAVVEKLLSRLQSGQRAALAEAITLVEGTNQYQRTLSTELLNSIMRSNEGRHSSKTFRVGISGPPGAGKSTFIEYFGRHLTAKGLKVAVLAVDPSSVMTGGSILGDKTRMPFLSKDANAYIRASPSRGHLGGATRSTNEAIAVCEAGGYDVIIVETVGVGQSEFAVANMVDMFALIIPPGGGDELQGLKRGIMEMSDIIIVNKSDGDLVATARRLQYEYLSAIKFIRPRCKEWKIPVKRVSSLNGEGIVELWEDMKRFTAKMKHTGDFLKRRQDQQKKWMWNHLMDSIVQNLLSNSNIKETIANYEAQVTRGTIAPGTAADLILQKFIENNTKC